MATRVKNAAMGVIRSGPIPNPGRHVPTERESNPKEILGIFINPREDAGGTKSKARNGMKKKKARTATKRRSTKKRASSVKKKRKPSTRRRKTTAKRAASRASNPRRKKKRTVTKRRKVAKRRTSARKTAAPKRRKRRSNPAPVVGYELRSANPKKRKKRKSSKRRKSAKITASKLASMLRSLAKRKSNPRKLTGRSSGSRGSASALVSAAELKRSSLLDTSRRMDEIEDAISILDEQIAAAEGTSLKPELLLRKAQLEQEKHNLTSGLGLLDAAIFSADSKKSSSPLTQLKDAILDAATSRRKEAARRAAISSGFRGVEKQRMEYYAIKAAITYAPDVVNLREFFPKVREEYTEFDLVTGKKKPGGKVSITDIEPLDKNSIDGKETLLLLPPESIAMAIELLRDNYIPESLQPSMAAARARISRGISGLSALMSGRIENPRRGRRRKAKGRSLKRGRRRKRRASNPRKKRKSGKRKSSKRKGRKRRSGRRRKNPLGGLDLLGKLSSNASVGEKAMAAGRIAIGATVGYASVGIGQWLMGMEVGGKSINKLLNGLGLSPAMSVTASAALASAASAAIVVGVGNAVTAVKSDQIPALIGIGARFLHALIDANWRDTSNTSKVLRSAVGLPSTVSGYGSWNPIGGYYNFQPVMAGPPKAGYQVAMAGAPRAGYSVSGMKPGYMLNGDMKAGYTVNGYANYAPAMAGYANFSPEMPVPKKNPMGSPF